MTKLSDHGRNMLGRLLHFTPPPAIAARVCLVAACMLAACLLTQGEARAEDFEVIEI